MSADRSRGNHKSQVIDARKGATGSAQRNRLSADSTDYADYFAVSSFAGSQRGQGAALSPNRSVQELTSLALGPTQMN